MNILLGNSLLQFLALIICLPFVVSQKCSRNNKPVIFNFGDANSDTGGFAAVTGLEDKYPYGRLMGGPTGRTTDGRLVIDFLCEAVGTHHLSPYLDALDRPNFSNGANFAILGACALRSNYPRYVPIDLSNQMLQFKFFYNHSTDVHSKHNKIRLQRKEEFFKDALYTIDIGHNDISYESVSLSPDKVMKKIPSFISEIKDAMWDIYRFGGRKFVVFNTGPLGCSPGELAVRPKLKSKELDQYGCLKSLNDAAEAFNVQLNALCKELRSEMKSSMIMYVDVYSIKYDLIANSNTYGFKNPLKACCGYGGSPYNFDPRSIKTCWTTGSSVCDKSEKFISWDGVHYTEAANKIIATKILTTNYSSPSGKSYSFCSFVGANP